MNVVRVPEAEVQGWKCAACDRELTYQAVSLQYMDGLFQVELLGCPQCGLLLVPEKLAQEKMHQVELLLEDK
jgi:hypothetical protein